MTQPAVRMPEWHYSPAGNAGPAEWVLKAKLNPHKYRLVRTENGWEYGDIIFTRLYEGLHHVEATYEQDLRALLESGDSQRNEAIESKAQLISYELLMHEELRITLAQMAFIEEAVVKALQVVESRQVSNDIDAVNLPDFTGEFLRGREDTHDANAGVVVVNQEDGTKLHLIFDSIAWRCYIRGVESSFSGNAADSINLRNKATWPPEWEGIAFGTTNPVLNCALYFNLPVSKAMAFVQTLRNTDTAAYRGFWSTQNNKSMRSHEYWLSIIAERLQGPMSS